MWQIRLLAFSIWAMLFSCDTDRNVAPVFEMYFTKYYGADGNQVSSDLLVNEDGTMVLLGNSTSQTGTLSTPFILKVDPRGGVLWQRKLGVEDETAVDVEVDRNGNLIVVSTVGTGEDSRIRIFKIAQDGVGIDSIQIESEEWQVAQSVTQVSDGEFLIAGYAGPELVIDLGPLPPPADQNDVVIYRVDEEFSKEPELLITQGGEHVGKLVKIFQSNQPEPIKYLTFGDSDRPRKDDPAYRLSFEVNVTDRFGNVSSPGPGAGDPPQIQMAATAIETPRFQQEAYLMVGSTFSGNNSSVFYAQYLNKNNELTIRFSKTLSLGRKMEGVSAAFGNDGTFFILANEFQDNNNRDMYLVKLADDGEFIGGARFGSLEGDDSAGAVRVLADGRIAVLGTIQLETQKKMVLIVLSPDGNFTNG